MDLFNLISKHENKIDWRKKMNLKPEVQASLKELTEPTQDTPILSPINYSGRTHPIYQHPVSQEVQILEPVPYEDCLVGSDQV